VNRWKFDVITLSGLPGSGTTTAALLVVRKTRFKYVNTREIFREMAEDRNLTVNTFGKLANEDPAIDRELDDRQIAYARRGSVLLEGRLAGFMLKNADVRCLAVWLEAPLEVRVRRVAERDSVAFEAALELDLERERDERQRFIEFYDFDLNDTSIYDLVLDSSVLSPEQICQAVLHELTHA